MTTVRGPGRFVLGAMAGALALGLTVAPAAAQKLVLYTACLYRKPHPY